MKRFVLFIGLPLLIGGIVLYSYLQGGRYLSTENAYIQTGIAMVSAGRSGHIERVLVKENQPVVTGQLLFKLDSEPFDLAVTQAEAMLAEKRTAIQLMKSEYHKHQVRLVAAKKEWQHANKELIRVSKLSANHAVSEERIAARENELVRAHNQVQIIEADIAAALSKLGGDATQSIDQFPMVQHGKGMLDQAKLDRRRAETHAGIEGIVAKLELHAGEYVQKGQALFSLVQSNDLWVEANLKETQLTHLRVGQPATLEIDAFPDLEVLAVVSSIAPASGAEFAILPPQNATGNWVKITQRVPVRLTLLDQQSLPQLRAGMSLLVTIDTGHKRSFKKWVSGIVGN